MKQDEDEPVASDDEATKEKPLEVQKVDMPSNRLENIIEQVLEDHIRNVGSHLVWLDKIRPKFATEDGKITVGSNVGEVFNHMQVQTY